MSATEPADQQQDAALGGITEIAVQGFKSLYDEQRIAVRPLTILAGANNSGKSSIMQPLLMMKQTLDATYDPGALKIDGPNVYFTSAEQFLSWPWWRSVGEALHSEFGLHRDRPSGVTYVDGGNFTVGLVMEDDNWVASTFEYRKGRGVDIVEMRTSRWPSFPFRPEMVITVEDSSEELIDSLPSDLHAMLRKGGESPKLATSRERCFLIVTLHFSRIFSTNFGNIDAFKDSLRSIVHVPSLRENPRAYRMASLDSQRSHWYEGAFNHYVASIIESWQNVQDDSLAELGRALRRLGLTWKIGVKRLNDVEIELRAARLPKSHDSERGHLLNIADVNIADMGVGVSQVLPALVALLTAVPGQMVYLEHPERDLHPKAQVALAKLLADAAKRGVRVVVETHSSLLLLGVQRS